MGIPLLGCLKRIVGQVASCRQSGCVRRGQDGIRPVPMLFAERPAGVIRSSISSHVRFVGPRRLAEPALLDPSPSKVDTSRSGSPVTSMLWPGRDCRYVSFHPGERPAPMNESFSSPQLCAEYTGSSGPRLGLARVIVEAEPDLRVDPACLVLRTASLVQRHEPYGCHSHDVPVVVAVTTPGERRVDRHDLRTALGVRDQLLDAPRAPSSRFATSESPLPTSTTIVLKNMRHLPSTFPSSR